MILVKVNDMIILSKLETPGITPVFQVCLQTNFTHLIVILKLAMLNMDRPKGNYAYGTYAIKLAVQYSGH